jgi:N-acetyl-S-(2-succino)cysteine monooxygenase
MMLEVFVAEVVPLLQRRGLFRSEYAGETLRALYGLQRPDLRFTAAAHERLKDGAST